MSLHNDETFFVERAFCQFNVAFLKWLNVTKVITVSTMAAQFDKN